VGGPDRQPVRDAPGVGPRLDPAAVRPAHFVERHGLRLAAAVQLVGLVAVLVVMLAAERRWRPTEVANPRRRA